MRWQDDSDASVQSNIPPVHTGFNLATHLAAHTRVSDERMADGWQRLNKAAHNREEEEEVGGLFFEEKLSGLQTKHAEQCSSFISVLTSDKTESNAATQGGQTELSQVFATGIFSQEEENKL